MGFMFDMPLCGRNYFHRTRINSDGGLDKFLTSTLSTQTLTIIHQRCGVAKDSEMKNEFRSLSEMHPSKVMSRDTPQSQPLMYNAISSVFAF